MRILVMGAGAVGGVYGALLSLRGHAVTFVARGAHLETLRERGLELRADGQARRLHPVHAVEAPMEAGPRPDLVLFTVKGYDTEPAARALRPAVGPATAVLTLQNGVDSVERLAAVLDPVSLLAGVTVIEAILVAPGVVEQLGPTRRIVLGESSGAPTPRVEGIAAALRDGGIEVTVTLDPRRAVWEKFIRVAPGATLTSACQASIGEIRQTAEAATLYRALVAEAVAVARASGVALPPDAVESALATIARLPATMKTSMQRDFERGRPVELEELTGAVVRLGGRLGVATPAFQALYAVLKVRAHRAGGGDAP